MSTNSRTPTQSTYTPLTITSFPVRPLTTTFTRPSSCGGIYSRPPGGILVIESQSGPVFDSSCFPPGFATEERSFFSPGIACPSGYYSACTGAPVSSITTVTCCPVVSSSISMLCREPTQLSEAWENQFCTWAAPPKGDTVMVTESANGRTSTIVKTLSNPEGLNAFGIRMVYQATDMPTTSTSGTASTSPSNQPSSPGQDQIDGSDKGGLSTGATIAIALVIPIIVIGAAVGFFFWWKRRRAAAPLPVGDHPNHHHMQQPVAIGTDGVYKLNPNYNYAPIPGTSPITPNYTGQTAVMPPSYSQGHAELPAGPPAPSELPSNTDRHEMR
ncbi:hypothetical protein QBC38DRAFT_440265 [Podospora fimiseda]|uniref:Uncharacterized protein n=1 Tax=Podospora fimiseda TaxID=252190 RepID=A0AAN7BXE1_9PEZI|nr:hypothetical protein QBC38DRAFT_440265 [Podospora fimiseda]